MFVNSDKSDGTSADAVHQSVSLVFEVVGVTVFVGCNVK